jgi:hypothetical protein
VTRLADGELVLIVEDNEKSLKLVRGLLQFHGFRSLEAVDAETGFQIAGELVARPGPDGHRLPGMDGRNGTRAPESGSAVVAMSVMPIAIPCDSNGFHQACSSRHSNHFPTKAL